MDFSSHDSGNLIIKEKERYIAGIFLYSCIGKHQSHIHFLLQLEKSKKQPQKKIVKKEGKKLCATAAKLHLHLRNIKIFSRHTSVQDTLFNFTLEYI